MPLREAGGGHRRLVLGQEIPVTGIFILGRIGTEARASDIAEHGKGDCVQRSSLWSTEERGKEGWSARTGVVDSLRFRGREGTQTMVWW